MLASKTFIHRCICLIRYLIEFLMVNCAVDITNQDLFLGSKIWISLLAGSVSDKVTAAPFQVKNALLNRVRNKFNLLK